MVEGTVTRNDFTIHSRVRDHTTLIWRCVGTAFGHFLLGSHNLMVTALGSCVKWPLALMQTDLGISSPMNVEDWLLHDYPNYSVCYCLELYNATTIY